MATAESRTRTSTSPLGQNTQARVDKTVATPGEDLSPLQTAFKHIESHTKSLQPGLSDLLLEKGKEITTLRHQIYTKEKNLPRLEKDEEQILVSARLHFTLTESKEAEELPEFIELQTETKLYVNGVRKELKKKIIAAGKIGIK